MSDEKRVQWRVDFPKAFDFTWGPGEGCNGFCFEQIDEHTFKACGPCMDKYKEACIAAGGIISEPTAPSEAELKDCAKGVHCSCTPGRSCCFCDGDA